MPIMFRCPGELRHTTRGFLYDQREFADAAHARADGWAETLEEAAGLVPAAAPASAPAQPAMSRREQLEATARALDIPFNARTTDATLEQRIAAKG